MLDEAVHCPLQQLESAGNTVMLLGQSDRALGLLAVADTIRPEAREVVQRLHGAASALWGTAATTTAQPRRCSAQVDISEVIAEVRPADKATTIRAPQQASRVMVVIVVIVVMVVGDGVNAALALATACIGSEHDVGKEAGDLLQLGNDLRAMVTASGLSRATMRTIRQNLF